MASIRDRGVCWPWQGYVSKNGYGFITVQGTTKPAHRAVWEHLVGPIPEGLELDHLCKVPLCVNPDHLEPVTQYINNKRSDSPASVAGRKTHCLRGHPFSPDNTTIIRRAGGKCDRRCKTCHRQRERDRHRKAA